MIPASDDNGYLPPGIHQATLDEIEARFGTESELRRVQFQSLKWLIDLMRRAGLRRLVIDGSFVTDRFEPNDIDCILLIDPDHTPDPAALDEIDEGLPFLVIHPAEPTEFTMLVEQFFATDRDGTPKGPRRGDAMSIQSIRQLEKTREKLRMLEGRLGELEAKPAPNPRTRDLTRRSLKQLINQLKEEIARFESHAPARSGGN